jgi:predicted RND superfamily exporter protein
VTDFVLRARFVLFGAVVVCLVGLVLVNRHVRYDQSLTSFFPDGDPDVVAYQKASATFGNDNIVFVTYEDPKLLTPAGMDRVAELAAALQPGKIEAVRSVQSLDRMPLFWQLDDRLVDLARLPALVRRTAVNLLGDNMATLSQANSAWTVGGAIRRAAGPALEDLRHEITSHPLFAGTLVDSEGKTSSLVVRLAPMEEQDPKATVKALRDAGDAFADRHGLAHPALVGPPVLLADGFTAVELDGQRLAVAGLTLIGLVMVTVTYSLWWAIVPILAGWAVWRAAETCMGLLGLRLSLSGGPLVAQIIVLTMPAASHLAIHFRDALRQGANRLEAARETLHAVARPIFWTAATGAIGYAALLTSNVVPVVQFGAVLAGCTLIATLATLLISPIAMLPPIPLEIPVRAGSASFLTGALNQLTRWAVDHPAKLVLAVLAVVLPISLGMGKLEYESNYINAFKANTRVVRDYQWTEGRLGGIGMVSLVVPAGPRLELEALEAHRKLGGQIASLRRKGEPAITQVVSLATVLDPQGKFAALPTAQANVAIQTKLDLIARAPQANLLASLWSPRDDSQPDTGWARIVIRLEERTPVPEKEATFRSARQIAEAMPEFQIGDRRPYVTGLSYLLTQSTRGVINSSWITFLWSAAGILFMLTWAFRGPKLAALAILPTFLAVALVLGVTGWSGVKLDLATALVASVALGLSVDDTFHCLLQYRRHRQKEPFRESLLASYHVTGAGVLLSSLAVAAGFAVLRFGEFVPFSNFGTMVGVATLGSSLGNLVLLPACLALGDRASRARAVPGRAERDGYSGEPRPDRAIAPLEGLE